MNPTTFTSPFSSLELRWFFEGDIDANPRLRDWFLNASPVPKAPGTSEPVWQGRVNDEPDRYLLLDGVGDMGIKWREGALQVKGRVARLGTQVFAGGHSGDLERWIKWSYSSLPDHYRSLFSGKIEIPVIAAHKQRALRKISLDAFTGAAVELPIEADMMRGFGLELTAIEAAGSSCCSLAFEAFPDDPGLVTAFLPTVSAFLAELAAPTLEASMSSGYPAWLQRFRHDSDDSNNFNRP